MRRRFGTRLLPLAVLGLALSACMPLYLPPVPDPPPFEAGTRVVAFTAELNAAGRPSLELTLADLHAPGWLAVQWMAPDNRQAASDSVWVEPATPTATFALPADVEPRPGEWRAVVSFGKLLLRQFLFVVE